MTAGLPSRLGATAALLVASLLVAPPHGAAQELVPVPDLQARVTDLTGTLEPSQAGALEAKLAALEGETGTQIAVLIVPTVRPEAIEQFALRVVEAWRLGREDVDDGALLLVALEDREVRIEVGYGLEGALTDATSNRIIDEAILPHFRTGDMYGGLAAGVDRMIAVARGEELPPPEEPAPRPGSFVPFAFVVFVLALVAGTIFRAMLGRVGGAVVTGGLIGVIVFTLSSLLGIAALCALGAFLLTLMFGGTRSWSSRGRSRHGGFGGFGGFGTGGGGFGGGGFSGGGGGFGGGGASGSW